MNLKINTFLVCITVQSSQEQWDKVFDFLEFKKTSVRELLCITTSGRDTYAKLPEIKKILEEKKIPNRNLFLMSKTEPDIHATYMRLELALSYTNQDKGVLLISELPLEDLFKPIQTDLVFGDLDLLEDDDKNNDELLAEFVLSLRRTPDLVIYDAQSKRFI